MKKLYLLISFCFLSGMGLFAQVIGIVSNSPVCEGDSIVLSYSGPSVTGYQWSGPNGSTSTFPTPVWGAVASPQTAGVYSLTVTNSSGGTSVYTTTVNVNPMPIFFTSTMSATCAGLCNGGVFIQSNGNYVYNFSNGMMFTSPQIPGLCAGSYSIWASDLATGCNSFPQMVNITEPMPLVATISNNGNCSAAQICGTATGGTAPYSYIWSTGSTGACLNTIAQPGTVTMTVTDANGCMTSASSTVSSTGLSVNISATNLTMPPAGTANTLTANVQGGTAATYLWSTGATTPTINVFSPGVYCVTVANTQGCQGNSCITIAGCNASVAINGPTTTCAGSPVTLLAVPQNTSGSLTYQWTPGNSSTATLVDMPTASITYMLVISDANGCVASTSHAVTVSTCTGNAPVANDDTFNGTEDNSITGDVALNDTDADNDPLTASPNGSPQNGIVTINPNGLFVYIPNPNFCGTDQFSYQVCDPSGNCDIATVTLNVTCTNDAPVAVDDIMTINLPNTTGSLFVGTNDYDPDVQTLFTISMGQQGTLGVATMSPSGTLTYVVNPGVTQGPDYVTYILCDNGNPSLCDTATVTIEIIPVGCNTQLTGQWSNASCNANNGTAFLFCSSMAYPITINLNGAPAGTFSTSSITIPNLAPGVYVFTATDANGCTSSPFTVVINNNSNGLYVYGNSTAPTTCNGTNGTATVINVSGATYAWSNGQTTQTATGLAAGWYSCTVSLASGCVAHTNVNVPVAQVCYSTISGYIYDDHLDNNCNAVNASPLSYHYVYLTDAAGAWVAFDYTDYNGYYQFNVLNTGNYVVHIDNYVACGWNYYGNLAPICGNTINVAATALSTAYPNNNFYLGYPVIGPDLSVYMWSSGTARPGIPRNYVVQVCNNGSIGQDGVVTLNYDPHLLNPSSISPTPTNVDVANHTITWAVPSLQPGICMHFYVTLTLGVTTPLGIAIQSTANVALTGGTVDVCPSNNSDFYYQISTNSYDPNMKESNMGPTHAITQSSDQNVLYRIDFQNTGTDTAYTVVLEDAIDLSKFDLSTLHPLASSHNYRLETQNNNTLVFFFENIMLPDSFVNEPASHGFVTFRIRMKDGLAIGSVIENTADIYFDFNDAVVTNTTSTVLVEPNSIKPVQNTSLNAEVFPNPNNGEFTLRYNLNEASPVSISVYDMLGRNVQQIQSDNIESAGTHTLNIKDLSIGVWYLQIQTPQGLQTKTICVVK